MNNRPIWVGESPIAKPKAGIMTYTPTGARSLAQYPIEKGESHYKSTQKARRISLPGFLLIMVKQI
jgi:hypothetical protein